MSTLTNCYVSGYTYEEPPHEEPSGADNRILQGTDSSSPLQGVNRMFVLCGGEGKQSHF